MAECRNLINAGVLMRTVIAVTAIIRTFGLQLDWAAWGE